MRTVLQRSLVVVLVAALNAPAALAWGNEGHVWINQVAAAKIPKSMPLFFRTAGARLSYLGPEPDRWRNGNSEPQLKYSQEPDHFFNSESLPADFGPLPDGRYRFIRKLYEERAKALAGGMDPKKADELLPEHVGFQPYIALEVYGRLKVAFREYRHLKAQRKSTIPAEQDAVFYAGWLGHYVADASQPLHISVNYDGWTQPQNPNGYTTKKGIHSDFEARFVKENLSGKDFAGLVHPPERLKDPWQDYQAYMKTTLMELPGLYELEKKHEFEGKGSEAARKFTDQRLAAGAQMLVDMWYSAWIESQTDPPDPYAKKPTDPEQSKTPKPAQAPKKE